jgi:hypothetical protein
MMNHVMRLEGIIYLYKDKNTGKNLYVGQSYDFKRRHKTHFNLCTKKNSKSDKKLKEIGEENVEIIILHKKIFDNFDDNEKNRHAYQLWANELEILEIDKYNTYINGLNGTKGGQHNSKNISFIEYSHKLSCEFFYKFIEAAKIYNKKENSSLGTCPRTYIIPEMDNYKLGEDLHKFRGGGYATIWADKEKVDLLNEVGYTQTSKEAGIDKNKRAGNTRSNNKLPCILKILDWIYEKYGHINIKQRSKNPIDFPTELFEGTNYKNIYSITGDLRKKGNNTFREKKLYYYNKYKLFDTDAEFMNHKFTLGLIWYYENTPFSYPQQSYIIPENTNLPKYMNLFNLGVTFANRNRTKNIPENLLELIETNKNKPRPTVTDFWENNPEKMKIMKQKVKKAQETNTPLFYRLRSWKNILKQKFVPLKITDLKSNNISNPNLSKSYIISQSNFSFESKSNNRLFTISKYDSIFECYDEARKYKIAGFYARKWYIKTKIKNIELEYEKYAIL